VPSYDSSAKNDEQLDPQLEAAHRVAVQDDANPPNRAWAEAERTEPMHLRNILTSEQIDELLKQVSAKDVWPRGSKGSNPTTTKTKSDGTASTDNGKQPPPPPLASSSSSSVSQSSSDKIRKHYNRPGLCPELRSVAHHLAWTDDHVVLYMHTDNWFVRTLPKFWLRIRGAMESRPWMNGVIPELDDTFYGAATEEEERHCQSMMDHVRCIELHHYSPGGGLFTPGHRDTGSSLTMSILLSDPDNVVGGDFVTYGAGGVPVAHKMAQGDAILFHSEKLHNISTVTSGVRQSLVVELWP